MCKNHENAPNEEQERTGRARAAAGACRDFAQFVNRRMARILDYPEKVEIWSIEMRIARWDLGA